MRKSLQLIVCADFLLTGLSSGVTLKLQAFSPGAEQPQDKAEAGLLPLIRVSLPLQDMDEQYGQYGHWHPQGACSAA